MLKKLKIGADFDFFEIIEYWPELIGSFLAPHSIPLKFKSQTLFILVRHSIYSQEISYLSEKIKEKLGKKFPHLANKISKIAFETNDSFFTARDTHQEKIKEQKTKLHPFSPEVRKLKQEANDLFPEILDPIERERWISLYIQSLS